MAINSPIFPSQQPSRNGHKYEGPELLFGISFCWEPLVAGCWNDWNDLDFCCFFTGGSYGDSTLVIILLLFVFCSLSFFSIQLLPSKNTCTWISLRFTSFTCFLFEVCFVPDAWDPASCQGHALQDVVSRVRIPSMALGDGKPLGPPVVAGAIFGTLFVFATKLMGSRNL